MVLCYAYADRTAFESTGLVSADWDGMNCIDAWRGQSRTGFALGGVILASEDTMSWLATLVPAPRAAAPPAPWAGVVWRGASEPDEHPLESVAVGAA